MMSIVISLMVLGSRVLNGGIYNHLILYIYIYIYIYILSLLRRNPSRQHLSVISLGRKEKRKDRKIRSKEKGVGFR